MLEFLNAGETSGLNLKNLGMMCLRLNKAESTHLEEEDDEGNENDYEIIC